jgi:hypothetical protein
MMAEERWITVAKRMCEFREQEAELMERRVFPSGILRYYQAPRVLERKCNWAIECNMAGYPCRWSYVNPHNDPFARKEVTEA